MSLDTLNNLRRQHHQADLWASVFFQPASVVNLTHAFTNNHPPLCQIYDTAIQSLTLNLKGVAILFKTQ